MKKSNFIQATLVLIIFSFIASCSDQKDNLKDNQRETPKGSSGIISNSDIEAILEIDGKKNQITGRISFNFKASEEDMKRGVIKVKALNMAFFQINQKQFSEKIELNHELGFFGLAVEKGRPQFLKINKKRNKIEGELKMFIDASILNSILLKEDNDDVFLTPVIPATCQISIDLNKAIESKYDVIQNVNGKLTLSAKSDDKEFDEFIFPKLNLELVIPEISLDVADLGYLVPGQSICIQPVFLRKSIVTLNGAWTIEETGEGLPFGETQLIRQWRKIGLSFEIRRPKNIFDHTFFEFTAAEANELRGLVDDDDCIEVFFVEVFSPNDLWGGGAAFGSGLGSAKVISSDENARSGIDFTHLAHEIGHVLGLLHPGSPPTSSAVPGSSGTLMCPSGFENDNPQRNSEENGDLISNPLIIFSFIPPSSLSPDCINSLDCGPCF